MPQTTQIMKDRLLVQHKLIAETKEQRLQDISLKKKLPLAP
jgi:hypothetical protein